VFQNVVLVHTLYNSAYVYAFILSVSECYKPASVQTYLNNKTKIFKQEMRCSLLNQDSKVIMLIFNLFTCAHVL